MQELSKTHNLEKSISYVNRLYMW